MENLTLPQQVARMDLERLRTYRENLEFYRGSQWPGPRRRNERRLVFNYARVLLEKLTSYLVAEVSFSLLPPEPDPEAEERAREAERAVRRVYEENHLEELDFDTELDATVLGDGCYKVTWDAQEERVRVTAPDVQARSYTVAPSWTPTPISTIRRSGQTRTRVFSISSTHLLSSGVALVSLSCTTACVWRTLSTVSFSRPRFSKRVANRWRCS